MAEDIERLRKKFSLPGSSDSTLGLVVNGTTVTGVIPGGPTDMQERERIEAHDEIVSVDGVETDDNNILSLLRGSNLVGTQVQLRVKKEIDGRIVEMDVKRDYKWWVESMRDVAALVGQLAEQAEIDGSPQQLEFAMRINEELRKLSSASSRLQGLLRSHIEELERLLLAASQVQKKESQQGTARPNLAAAPSSQADERRLEEVNREMATVREQVRRAVEHALRQMKDLDVRRLPPGREQRSPENPSGSLQADVDALKRAFDATTAELEDNRRRYEAEIADLQEEKSRLLNMESEIMQELAKGCDRIFRMEAEVTVIEATRKKQEELCKKMSEKLKDAEVREELAREEAKGLASEIEYLKEQNSQQTRAIRAMEVHMREMETSVRTYEKQVAMLSSSQKNAAQAAIELQENRTIIANLEKELREVSLMLEHERHNTMDRATKNENLQQELSSLKRGQSMKEAKQGDLQKDLLLLKRENAELKRSCEQLQLRFDEQQRKYQMCLQERDAHAETINKLTAHFILRPQEREVRSQELLLAVRGHAGIGHIPRGYLEPAPADLTCHDCEHHRKTRSVGFLEGQKLDQAMTLPSHSHVDWSHRQDKQEGNARTSARSLPPAETDRSSWDGGMLSKDSARQRFSPSLVEDAHPLKSVLQELSSYSNPVDYEAGGKNLQAMQGEEGGSAGWYEQGTSRTRQEVESLREANSELQESLRRASKTAEDAVRGRDEMLSRTKKDMDALRNKLAQLEELSASLESQLRAERMEMQVVVQENESLKRSSLVSQVSSRRPV
eukprot:342472-Hanusia_phi.AAC.3